MKLFRILRVCAVIVCVLLSSLFVSAQNHAGVQTPSLFSTLEMPAPHNDSIALLSSSTQPYVFAYPLNVSLSVADVAAVFFTDSTVEYRLCITSPNAVSLNLIFSDFYLPENASLFLFSKDSVSFFGPFTNTQNSYSGVFATPIVEGNALYVSLSVPLRNVDSMRAVISQISYGFRDFKGNLDSELKNSGYCNVDINCSEGNDWVLEKRAVCKLVISGTTVCTGTLLNNTLQDGTPYVLTANHCLSTQYQANETTFYFGYEHEFCDGGAVSENKFLSGSQLRATAPYSRVDFTLLEINQIPPESFEPYYAGWDASEVMSEKSVCIHHPRGDVKKICIDDDVPESASFYSYAPHTHWEIADWELGTTESGSSGSAIFNANHQVFGSLSGGQATCENPVFDYFSKFASAYNRYSDPSEQLQIWLDPLNYNVQAIPGFDPFNLHPNLVSNISKNDSVLLWNFNENVHGYFAGCNDIGWTSIADRFVFVVHKNIARITYAVEVLPCADLSNIELCVWNGQAGPDSVLFSTIASSQMLVDSAYLCVVPETPIETNGNFWVGYRYINSDTCVSFKHAQNRANEANQMYVLYQNAWIPASEISAYTSLAVEVYCTNEPDTLPSIISCEKPLFDSIISQNQYSFYSNELFQIDSIPGMYDTTRYMHVSTKMNVSDWGQADMLDASCVANKYILNSTDYIRGLSLGVREIYDTTAQIYYAIWNANGERVAASKVSNDSLLVDYFNQVHFDTPVFVQNSFYAGICYDTSAMPLQLSLYSYFDSNMFIDSYFYTDNMWISYADMAVNYNFAIQPITCYSPYHFNKDSARILKYPVLNSGFFEFMPTKKFIIFPTYCTKEFNIRWDYSLYENVRVELYTRTGVKCMEQDVSFFHGAYRVSVQDLPAGLYIVRVITDLAVEERKITVYR